MTNSNAVELKIKSEQTRHYGNVSQTFAVETIATVKDEKQRKMWYEKLRAVIDEEFAAFEHNSLPRVEDDKNDNTAKWSGGSLVKIIASGKIHYKLKTGTYTKWGVPVYEEILPQFPAGDYEWEQLDLTGYEGELLMKNGNPTKVISCRLSQ